MFVSFFTKTLKFIMILNKGEILIPVLIRELLYWINWYLEKILADPQNKTNLD